MNTFDSDFNQVWMGVKDIEGNPEVPTMQKIMAKQRFMFEAGGRFLQLIPKESSPSKGFESYDDEHLISHVGQWKTEDGRIFVDEKENGEQVWSEAVPTENGFEVFGFFRLIRHNMDSEIRNCESSTGPYKLICHDCFMSRKKEYAEGEAVEVIYPYIATDTSYKFQVDAEGVDISYEGCKAIIRFFMPAHDVEISCFSRNVMTYNPVSDPSPIESHFMSAKRED